MSGRTIPGGLQIAPSLLSADFAHLADEIGAVAAAGVEVLHLDVMDGHFVPNITFGPPLVRTIRRTTDLFLDAHLMISDPVRYLAAFADAGADLLTVHVEALAGGREIRAPNELAEKQFREVVDVLGERGCLVGLTFRPGTDPSVWLERFGDRIDLVLIMTVEPGFGGQSFMEGELDRLRLVSRMRRERGWSYRVEVDGGIDPSTVGRAVRAGAELLVAGQAVYGQPDRAEAISRLLAAAAG